MQVKTFLVYNYENDAYKIDFYIKFIEIDL